MSETESESKARELEEPTPDLHIFDLNDDCLVNVVSFLKFDDILNLHDIHPRFHAAIAANSSHMEIEFNRNNLKTFGRTARKINLLQKMNELEQSAVEGLMTQYCSEGNVTHFETDPIGFQINENFLENNSKFFRSLKSLVVLDHMMASALFRRILDIIGNVENLRIQSIRTSYDFWYFLTKFQSRQLKSLEIRFPLELVQNEALHFPNVDSLKTLSALYYGESFPVLMHFPNIENLRLEAYAYSTLNELQELRNLKKLRLGISKVTDCKVYSLLQHLAKQNKLEHLDLHLWWVENEMEQEVDYEKDFEIIDILKQFTKLKSLALSTLWRVKLRLLDLVAPLTEL